MCYLRIAAAAAICLLIQGRACLAGPADEAAKVIACFNAGSRTVQSMYACSGFWVTPRALMFCLLQSHCPLLDDTAVGRATLDASLGRDQRNTQLTPDGVNFPKFPAASQIDDCNAKEATAEGFETCVLTAMAAAPPGLLPCASITDDKIRAGCLIATANDPELMRSARCFNHIAGAQDFLSCLNNRDYAQAAQTAASCLQAAGARPADCLDPGASAADAALIACVSAPAITGAQAAKCLEAESPDLGKVHQAATCLRSPGADAVRCAFLLASGSAATVIDCLATKDQALARAACVLANIADFAALDPVHACAERSLKGAQLADCVAPSLGDDTPKFVACMSSRATAKLDRCLTVLGTAMAEAMRAQTCLLKTVGTVKSLACVSAKLGGEAPKIVACALGDRGKVLPCLLGGRPDYPLAEQVYACVDGGRDAGAVIENCSGSLIGGEKTRELAACVAESASDRQLWPACAGLAVLSAETARDVSCAANNDGATSFALCLLGAAMNEEWRIAAACAVEAGGDPASYAGCAAGRLALQELAACFGGKAGRECFAADDAVARGVRDALRGLVDGPGRNGASVAAVNKIVQLAGGPNSVVVNPAQIGAGRNSVFHNTAKMPGGDASTFHNLRPIAKPAAVRGSVVSQAGRTKVQ